jgi:uncharacterized protein (DUF1810 family)
MGRLERFKTAQNSPDSGFESALHEIRTGAKQGHWIWYIFPQLSGLGTSGFSRAFAIDSEAEAIEFLQDSELRQRLLTIARAVADQLRSGDGASLGALMRSEVDARKVVSSLTLFGAVAKQLYQNEKNDALNSMAMVADEVLAAAAAQGYPPCAYTLRRLREMRSTRSEPPSR